MNKLFSFLIVCWLCILSSIGCVTHLSSFEYYGAKTMVQAPIKVIPIYIDKDFGAADKVAIDDAITQWNYALNGNIVLVVASTEFDMDIPTLKKCVAGGCWMFMPVNSANPMVEPANPGQPMTLAWTNDIGVLGNRIYFIRDRIQNEWMTGITLHEMGHLLGAEHDSAYLMRPSFSWASSRCVDYDAALEVAKYWNLDIKTMKYCVYESAK